MNNYVVQNYDCGILLAKGIREGILPVVALDPPPRRKKKKKKKKRKKKRRRVKRRVGKKGEKGKGIRRFIQYGSQ